MKQSWLFVVLVLGCVFTHPFVKANDVASDDDEAPAAPPQAEGGAAKNGTAEAIREDPENSKPYVNYGQNKFSGVQGALDKHFENKKMEGDKIHKGGELTQMESAHMQGKMEKGQYDEMYKTFKWAENQMETSVKHLDPNRKGKGEAAESAPEAPAAEAAPATPAPAPAGDVDTDDE